MANEFLVDPARLHWRPEGDIHGSYSGDRIAESKPIRTPFHHDGALWVCTSIHGAEHHGYRLVTLKAFTDPGMLQIGGHPTTYSAKVHDGEATGETARNDPNGFYNGMTVTHGGKYFVMVGPEYTFKAGDAMTDAPPIAGEADTEREAKLDAERATLEYRQRSTKRLDAGRVPIGESPLFGGSAQGGLFE